MAQLLVRDLKEETIERLKLRAKQHHRSLQGEVKFILEKASQTFTTVEIFARSAYWRKKLANQSSIDGAQLIREDRDRKSRIQGLKKFRGSVDLDVDLDKLRKRAHKRSC